MKKPVFNTTVVVPRDNEKGFKLLDVKECKLEWKDAIVSESVDNSLKTLVSEIQNEELLGKYGLKPKRKLLFYGPPGTGKTLSAQILSSVLGYPLAVVKFEAVISSYLGETSTHLRKIFDFLNEGKYVVLFDEFDVVGKKRDDPTEHGEIKRVVNNFMLMLEEYSGDCVIIASTNHPHILGRAVWRRFDDAVYFDMPSEEQREMLFKKNISIITTEKLEFAQYAEITSSFSGADVERACINAVKKLLIDGRTVLMPEYLDNAVEVERKRIEWQSIMYR